MSVKHPIHCASLQNMLIYNEKQEEPHDVHSLSLQKKKELHITHNILKKFHLSEINVCAHVFYLHRLDIFYLN